MAKIIKIIDQLVIVGIENGTTIQTSKSNFDFEIEEFMKITVHQYGNKYTFTQPLPPSSPPGENYANKALYIILRFIFGEFGLHHFYAGNKKKAYIYLGITLVAIFLYTYGKSLLPHYDIGSLLIVIGSFIFLVLRIYIIVTSIMLCFKQADPQGRILIKS